MAMWKDVAQMQKGRYFWQCLLDKRFENQLDSFECAKVAINERKRKFQLDARARLMH